MIDARDSRARARHRKGDAPIADAVFEETSVRLCERDVVANVIAPRRVDVRVINGVFEMRARADVELGIDPSAAWRALRAQTQ
jgi:hypothetical protein